jgi:hypothetical protein
MMLAVTIGHFVSGMLLGARFRVIVLAPAAAVSVLVVAAAVGAEGSGFGEATLTLIAALAALQIGFLAGAALRDRQTTRPEPRPSPGGALVVELSPSARATPARRTGNPASG